MKYLKWFENFNIQNFSVGNNITWLINTNSFLKKGEMYAITKINGNEFILKNNANKFYTLIVDDSNKNLFQLYSSNTDTIDPDLL